MELKIGWLFPDSLYLHGDRGNVLALKRAAERVGYTVEVEKIDFNTEDFTPTDYDFLFCSPGEIATFTSIVDFLKPYSLALKAYIKADRPLLVTGNSIGLWGTEIQRQDGSVIKGLEIDFLKPYSLALKAYIKADRPLLVTGNSIGLWGTEIQRQDGSVIKGLEIIDVVMSENEAVYGDDLYYTCTMAGETMEIIGNQIQMADFHSDEEEAFGSLIYGYGNSGKDKKEGFVIDHAVFTNTLGPVLVQNPWLTKAFLKVIAENQEVEIDLDVIDTTLEEKSFASKKEFILNKTSYLTNCK